MPMHIRVVKLGSRNNIFLLFIYYLRQLKYAIIVMNIGIQSVFLCNSILRIDSKEDYFFMFYIENIILF